MLSSMNPFGILLKYGMERTNVKDVTITASATPSCGRGKGVRSVTW